MDAFPILRSEASRRQLFTFTFLFFALINVALYILYLQFDLSKKVQPAEVFLSIMTSLYAGFLLSVCAVGFFYYLFPNAFKAPMTAIVPPRELVARLDYAVKAANEYWLFVRTGRYFRHHGLQVLGLRSVEQRISIPINVIMLDPRNTALIGKYVNYRRGVTSRDSSIWTIDYVQSELLATIAALIEAKTKFPLLEIKIGFSQHISIFRFDATDKEIYITRENIRDDAVYINNEHSLFSAYIQELRLLANQVPAVPVEPSASAVITDGDIALSLKTFWNKISPSYEVKDSIIGDALKFAKELESPYAR